MITLNILFVAPNVCMDNNTGDVVHVTELANSFSKLGHNVFLIARSRKSLNNNFNFLFNFKNIKSINYGKLWVPYVMISAFFSILSLLINKKIDLIYERHHIFGIGVFLGKIFRIPTILEVNGLMIEEMRVLRSFHPLFINVAQIFESFVFQRTNCIISVTEGIKKYLSEKYSVPSDRIITISNGVNIDLFKPIDNSKEALNLSPEFNYVLFVGSLIDWQGVDTLIKASPLILKDMPKTHFLIIGEGSMKVPWMELANQLNVSENFLFMGAVLHEYIPLYINASDICVVPKKPLKSGYSPLKLYEYMACGKAVIASDLEGFEILNKANAGILVEPNNSNKLSEAILKLLTDKDLMHEMGLNGRREVQDYYSWYEVARKVIQICIDVKRK